MTARADSLEYSLSSGWVTVGNVNIRLNLLYVCESLWVIVWFERRLHYCWI